jgi:uncharacterized surface protein with fasciclin (FAS1) repeats
MQRFPKLIGAVIAGFATTSIFALVPAQAGAHAAHGEASAHQHHTIVDAAVASSSHSTLVAAVKAAGLVDTLAGPGPFTVFAPTDDAFAKLPEGTVATLLEPENRDTLTKVLTYHVVPGRITAPELLQLIEQGGGEATLDTVAGGTLTARVKGGEVVIVDETGGKATVKQADLVQSNGVIHVTDSVSMPG